MSLHTLPITTILPDLCAALQAHSLVLLTASPGAGKTTGVPPSLIGESWLHNKKLLLLEPRRLAAVAAARYMAEKQGEVVGQTIGYRIRGDSKSSSATRIEVITEGILTRILQEDPTLEGIGGIIFDEFHERNLHGDLGLALALDVQRALRPDLRILIMSATLATDAIKKVLGEVPHIHSEGKSFPVKIIYCGKENVAPLHQRVATITRQALHETEGDILVFLPGRGEILRTKELLEAESGIASCIILPLYGDLSDKEQRAVLTPAPIGMRKIILSTNIAETSITIDGVRVVIDSGFMRIARYDPNRDMSTLETVQIPRSSSEQRKGRAGRQAPGYCYRLWSEAQQHTLLADAPAEITNTDLVPFALELALWGTQDISSLTFIDAPSLGELTRAREILVSLGALDSLSKITPHGKAIARLGVHPRLGHMLLVAKEAGHGALACEVATLLEERDILGSQAHDLSLFERWQTLTTSPHARKKYARHFTQRDRLQQLLGISPHEARDPAYLGALVGLSYPDRIAVQREESPRRYLLANGVGAELPATSLLSKHSLLAIAELGGSGAHRRITLAEPLQEEHLKRFFSPFLTTTRKTEWNISAQKPVTRARFSFRDVPLSSHPVPTQAEEGKAALFQTIQMEGLTVLPWSERAFTIRERARWIEKSGVGGDLWPSWNDKVLLESLEEWLSPFLTPTHLSDGIRSLELSEPLLSRLPWKQRTILDELAPATIALPSGTRALIDYTREIPTISVFLQELYGQEKTPSIGGGKVSVVLELLSPAKRPLQVTRDLPSFWSNSYKEVRKEMLSRYPKHFWPEDPAHAAPQRGTRKRRG